MGGRIKGHAKAKNQLQIVRLKFAPAHNRAGVFLKTTNIYKKMGLKKGATNNPRGRPKGTPNKVTTDLRKWVDELLHDKRQLFIDDLGKLDPYQRTQMFEKLMQHVLPKQAAITVEGQIQAEFAAIERLLNNAPDEAVNAITERLMKLNQLNKQKDE